MTFLTNFYPVPPVDAPGAPSLDTRVKLAIRVQWGLGRDFSRKVEIVHTVYTSTLSTNLVRFDSRI